MNNIIVDFFKIHDNAYNCYLKAFTQTEFDKKLQYVIQEADNYHYF